MLQSFLSTALPIVLAVLFGIWTNNKRIDDLRGDMNVRLEDFARRLDDFGRRLDRIETILDDIRKQLSTQNERITRLELTHH
jgi:archaellum component FlaC